jgi:hypothetical protein
MKQIALAFVLAFAFTTGMAVVTVVAHTDQAMADSATADAVYSEQGFRMWGHKLLVAEFNRKAYSGDDLPWRGRCSK